MWHWYAVTGMGDDMGKRGSTRMICSGAQTGTKRIVGGFKYPRQGACLHLCLHP